MRTYVLAVDLRGGRKGVEAYRRFHRKVWPEVLRSLRRVGVRDMDIYLLGQRLVMVMAVKKGFDRKRSFAAHVASNPRCREWEAAMARLQRRPPGSRPGETWTPLRRVFSLREQLLALPGPRRLPGRPRRHRG